MASPIAGVDEAGRGPLAGPVYAAAVILHPERPISGLRDSKKLTEKKREFLFDEIQAKAWCWAIGIASVEEIDHLNIFHEVNHLVLCLFWRHGPEIMKYESGHRCKYQHRCGRAARLIAQYH